MARVELIDKVELFLLENDVESVDNILSSPSLAGVDREVVEAASYILHAKYHEALLSVPFLKSIIGDLQCDFSAETLESFAKSVTSHFLNSDVIKDEELLHLHQLAVLLVGVSYLMLFVQANWTGPSLANPPKEISAETRSSLVKKLDRDGEVAYHKMNFPQYLICARICIVDDLDRLRTSSWWNARTQFVHQRVLSGRVPSLKEELNRQFQLVSRNFGGLAANPEKETERHRELAARANLEQGLVLDYYREVKQAKECFDSAQTWTGLSVTLTGAMGKRTKFQTFDTPQLILLAQSRENENGLSAQNGGPAPREVENEDPLLLHTPALVQPTEEKNMRVIDQAILIALCLDVKNSNATHRLTTEQMSPYVRRVLTHANNWMVHSTGLWIKSRLESESSKTADRAAFQLQALVEQWEDETAAPETRLKYVFDLPFPVRWQLKKEVGERFMTLGAAATALQLFEELEMWDKIIDCYRIMDKTKKAEEIVSERLLVAPTPELWCIMGDLKTDPEMYLKGWELSGHRYARAMRSLAKFYLYKNEYEKSVECFSTALDINPLFPASWFSLGAAAMHCSKWEDALVAFSRVVSLEPEEGEAWANMASIFIMQKKKNEAFVALQEGLKYRHDSWKMWQNFLVVCMDIGEFSQAIHAMQELLNLREKEVDIPILKMIIHVVLNDIPDRYGEIGTRKQKPVTELLGRITSQISTNPDIWSIYATFHGGLGNKEKELDCLTKMVRYTETAGWERDPSLFEKVAVANIQLAGAYLATNDPKNVYTAKLKLRSLAKKTQDSFGTTATHKLLVEKLQETEALENTLQQTK